MKNPFYIIWCFFMDSRKGATKYWNECNEYAQQQGHMFITFAPYPGRFKWRQWKFVKKYKSWRFKKNHPKIGEGILPIVSRVFPAEIGRGLVGCQPMPTPTSPIFTLKWHENKEGLQKVGQLGDIEVYKDGGGI